MPYEMPIRWKWPPERGQFGSEVQVAPGAFSALYGLPCDRGLNVRLIGERGLRLRYRGREAGRDVAGCGG